MKDHVTDGLKTHLQSLPNFKSDIEDDPLALLLAIKTAVHKNFRTQCPSITLHLQLNRLLRTKQLGSEDPPCLCQAF